MVEDLHRHKSARFTRDEQVAHKAPRSPFFDSLGEVDGVYDIKDFKRNVIMKRTYQCATAAYQLAKLRMLEFYYDFLDISVDKNLSCAL